uniref:Uncharacterized protein n=1 Tax=Heterorhabditis bacteriophora TaxID=37862 RepID=A0A1I7WI74_HETBA
MYLFFKCYIHDPPLIDLSIDLDQMEQG